MNNNNGLRISWLIPTHLNSKLLIIRQYTTGEQKLFLNKQTEQQKPCLGTGLHFQLLLTCDLPVVSYEALERKYFNLPFE